MARVAFGLSYDADYPRAAPGRDLRRSLPEGRTAVILSVGSLHREELAFIPGVKRRFPHLEIWLTHTDGRQSALAEAMRLALSYPTGSVARELVHATLAMISGQQLDLEGGAQLEQLHALKTGALLSASVMCALWAADVPISEHEPWRMFAGELGLLFQVVDDVLDGDGYVLEVGEEGARRLAGEAAERAQTRLTEIEADTDVLASIVDGLAVRTT